MFNIRRNYIDSSTINNNARFYHAFIIYVGGWNEPVGFEPCTIYSWLDKLAYAFMLPTFVFISGYVWGCQINGLTIRYLSDNYC